MRARMIGYCVLFGALNLAFIPLISLYGLQICPVLHVGGFAIGCYYATLFISVVLLINGSVLGLTFRQPKWRKRLLSNTAYLSVGGYVLASLLALLTLYLLSDTTHLGRSPEVMVLASLLIGITQHYGLSWVLQQNTHDAPALPTLQRSWFQQVMRTLAPIGVTLVVILHFIWRQLEITDSTHNIMILLAFLFLWMIMTYLFFFLEEKSALKAIQAHIKHIRQMDTDYKTTIPLQGLWGMLANQLNDLSDTLKQRSNLINSFSRFVSRDVASRALDGEIVATEGKQKKAVVIMTDIRGFTALAETLPAEIVVEMLNRYFSAMLDVMNRHGLMIDKFIGDGMLAYVDAEEDEQLSIRQTTVAAHEMLAASDALNKKFADEGLPAFHMGIGIDCGQLVMGLIGAESKLQQTIIGDIVNHAARLEGLCKMLGSPLIISKRIWQALSEDEQTEFADQGKQVLAGIEKEIGVFALKVK